MPVFFFNDTATAEIYTLSLHDALPIFLKKLGRQPWTWVTTGGWVALINLGAIYAGHVFKSGELHYRTVELVDQIGRVHVWTPVKARIRMPSSAFKKLNGTI